MEDDPTDERWEGAFEAGRRTEREMVRAPGRQLGYGRIMQLCEELWRERIVEKGLSPGSVEQVLHRP